MFAINTVGGRKPTLRLNKTMHTSLISVVVLTYENADKIYRTLDSVLMQDYPNLELIISDDASETFPKGQIEAYLSGKTKRFRVRQSETNLGTVAHCNAVAVETSGSFIKFLASGDGFSQSTSLRELMEFAQRNPESPVVTSASRVCNEDFSTVYYDFPSSRRVKILNNTSPEKLYNILVFSNIVSSVGALFQREFFTRYQGFDTHYHLLEDWPTWLRLTRNGIAIPCCPLATVYYAVGGVSSQDGTAFEAKGLRNDMILCYEREILPYLDKIPFVYKKFACFQFEKLTKNDNRNTIERVKFLMKYMPFEVYRGVKSVIKRLITVVKGGTK